MSFGRLPFLVSAAVAALVVAALASPVGATPATRYVDAAHGSGSACTLAAPCASIQAALAVASSGDTIDVATGSYTASAGFQVVDVTVGVTLEGGWDSGFTTQSARSTIDGQNSRRGVQVETGVTATLDRFVVQNGATVNTINGGGIRNFGTLTVSNSLITGNGGVEGAGIANGGTLTLLRSTVSNQNIPTGQGSGLYAYFGSSARIVESTFSLNDASRGGAINVADGGTVAIVNSTLATNRAEFDGGGVYVGNSGVLELSNVSIVSNTAANGNGGGVSAGGANSVRLRNTLIAGNTAQNGNPDCAANAGAISSAGYNLIGSTTGCQIAHATGDLFNVAALLNPLADNGGPTQTESLQPASPAIDGGNPGGCLNDLGVALTTDQRGLPRSPAGDDCDIGAFEVQIPTNDTFAGATVLAPTGGTTTGGNATASKQVGEPDHAGDEGGASVWFDWTAPNGSAVSFDTNGSGFDTLLAVYTGGDVAHLTRIASNDDIGVAEGPSRVCFTPTAGTTYHVAVDGYAGDTGAFTLTWGAKSDASACPTLPPVVAAPATPHVGDMLNSDTGTWDHPGVPSRQWYRCMELACEPILGATGASYTVQARDVGAALFVSVLEGGARNASDRTGIVVRTASASAANGRIFWATNRDNLSHYEIYSMLPNGTSLQRLTDTSHFSTEPAPSPDGSRIAFVQDGDLALMNPDGSGVVTSSLGAGFPVWSPDGSRIAFATAAGGQFDGIDVVGVNGDDWPDTNLISDTPGSFYDLAWSPDGSTIAFTYKDGGDFDIATIAADGRGGYTNLTDGSTADEHSPAWSPDGTKLLFVRGPVFGGITDGDLYVMNADGSGQTLLVDGDQQHVVTSAAWSPNGTTILFSENDNGNSELYTIAAGGGSKTLLVSHLDRDELPAWGAPASFALTIAKVGSGSGSVTCSGGCAATYADGTSVTLTATPSSGSTFSGWSGACAGTSSCTVTMLAARSVTATFDAAPAPPSGGGGGGGGGGVGSSGIPPDIHVDVTASAQTPPAVGSDLLWFVTVSSRNTGGSSDVWLDLTLPAGWTYDHSYADRGPGCFGNAQKLTCDVGFINQSALTHVTLWGKVAQAGDLALTASAKSMLEPEFDQSDNTVTLTLATPAAPPPAPPSAPVPQPPSVSGTPLVGSTLHTQTKPGAHYQWQLCTAKGCTPIKGATRPALKLVKAYAGKGVRVVVTLNGKATASKKLVVRGRAASR